MRTKTFVRVFVALIVLCTMFYFVQEVLWTSSSEYLAPVKRQRGTLTSLLGQKHNDASRLLADEYAKAEKGVAADTGSAAAGEKQQSQAGEGSMAEESRSQDQEKPRPTVPVSGGASLYLEPSVWDSPQKEEYRGVPGAWTGACPLRDDASSNYASLGIWFLRASTDPRAQEKKAAEKEWRKKWQPGPLPDHVLADYANESRYETPKGWSTDMAKKGHQWFHLKNFCVVDGVVTFYDPNMGLEGTGAAYVPVTRKKHLPLYNEFTRRRNKLGYEISSVPRRLPGPIVDNPAWILSFWCQDLFHSTMTMMPAHTVKRANNSDIYVTICKKSPCHVKFGSPQSWDDPYNSMWGNDKQFPYSGNPYWKMYRIITDEPYRLRPLHKGHKYYYPPDRPARCYREGIMDKKWFIEVTRGEAIAYSDGHLRNLGIVPVPRKCNRRGGYRMTLINRQGATRKLANMQEVAELGRCLGFNVTVVAFERFAIRDQIELVANTDLVIGMHGNGMIWTQFQQKGAYLIEIMGVWYERYAKLWGNGYNHTSTKDKHGVKGNEYVPFQADMKQLEQAMRNAKDHLDTTSCGDGPYEPDMSVKHKQIWEVCFLFLAPRKAAFFRKKQRCRAARPPHVHTPTVHHDPLPARARLPAAPQERNEGKICPRKGRPSRRRTRNGGGMSYTGARKNKTRTHTHTQSKPEKFEGSGLHDDDGSSSTL